MSKKIAQVAVAGGILMNVLGGTTLASAYSGETSYPENIVGPLIITEVDVRNNSVSAFFRDDNNLEAVFKGVGVSEGEIDDDKLNLAYPGVDTGVVRYVEYNLWTENWVETEVGIERTYGIDGNLLAENASGEMSFYYLYSNNLDDSSLNINGGRMNYRECLESEEYQSNDEAVCRAELWADGWLRYRPYVRWKRFADFGENEGEEGDYFVYRDNIWLNGRIVEDMERVSGDNGWIKDDGTNSGGEEGVENNLEGVDSEEGKPRIEYVEKVVEAIKEVPVEKIVEIVREVPVEKIVEVLEEVPVEKIVEIITEVPAREVKEVFKEVPVEKIAVETKEVVREVLTTSQAIESGENVQAEQESESENGEEILPDEESVKMEEIEVPMLGRETNNNLLEKIMTFMAGLVSALAILGLVFAFKRKGGRIRSDQQ